jgi:hypothetical protein
LCLSARRASQRNEPLYEHGDVVFILPSTFSPGVNPAGASRIAREVLEKFDFANDHFTVAGGDPLAAIVCSGILYDISAEKEATHFNYLRYERPKGANPAAYTPMRIEF